MTLRDPLTCHRPPPAEALDPARIRAHRPGRGVVRPLRLWIRGSCPGGSPWPAWLPVERPVPLWAAPADPPAVAPPSESVVAVFLDPRAGTRPAVTARHGRWTFHFDPWETAAFLGREAYLRPGRPWHTRLSGLYGALPGPVRLAGHHAVSALAARRAPPGPPFPAFPADPALEAVRLLLRRALGWPDRPSWPAGKRTVTLLTHDVDTAQGQARILPIARAEERLGLRACYYVVGDRFPLDHGLLTRLRDAGHEVGLHGARHDQKLAYLGARAVERRLDRCRPLTERHEVVGFRSPALLMSPTLARALGRRFAYDTSIPDTDTGTILGPHRGCSGILPYFRGDMVELPLTLPLDDRLRLLGLGPSRILTAWKEKLAWIDTLGGLAVVTTHTEPHLGGGDTLRAVYENLLRHITEHLDTAVLLPREAARWWRGEPLELNR